MKSLDELIEQRQKLKEFARYAQIFGGKVRIGDALMSLTELKEMLNDVEIKITTVRQNRTLKRVK